MIDEKVLESMEEDGVAVDLRRRFTTAMAEQFTWRERERERLSLGREAMLGKPFFLSSSYVCFPGTQGREWACCPTHECDFRN